MSATPLNKAALARVEQRPQRARVEPGSMAEKVQYARELAGAQVTLPREYRGNPGDLLMAMEFASALGIPLMNAITQVHVMDGKPTCSAILIKGLVIKAGHRVRSGHSPDGMSAWCSIWRSDDPEFEYRAEWDLGRAEQAQLLRVVNGKIVSKTSSQKSTNWEKATRQMLSWRALTECAREACPEAILGLYTPDELGAQITDDGRVEQYAAPAEVIPDPVTPVPVRSPDSPPAPAQDEPVDAEIVDTPDDGWDAMIQSLEDEQDAEGLRTLWQTVKTEPDARVLQARIKAAGIRVAARLAEAQQEPTADEGTKEEPEQPTLDESPE